MEHARLHIHERAAYPKHIEVLGELPKTAVGKVFKPDLRKSAIARVYNAALEAAGCPARVVRVVDDKKRGLLAQIEAGGAAEGDIAKVLSTFTRPWELA
jgi:fatty-acyl-CoA synthase/long-chain acyl-CoA synthetase